MIMSKVGLTPTQPDRKLTTKSAPSARNRSRRLPDRGKCCKSVNLLEAQKNAPRRGRFVQMLKRSAVSYTCGGGNGSRSRHGGRGRINGIGFLGHC